MLDLQTRAVGIEMRVEVEPCWRDAERESAKAKHGVDDRADKKAVSERAATASCARL